MFQVTALGWAATVALVLALLAFDLLVSARWPHAVRLREATAWSLAYITIALLFGVVFGAIAGWDEGGQYFTGYILEKSLSLDNLFVFLIIISSFAVPPERQPWALTIGIAAALALRAVFIVLGAALLDAFSFMFCLFGLALLVTAAQLLRHRNEDPSVEDNVLVVAARRMLPLTARYHGGRILTRVEGRTMATPMLLVLIAIGSADLLFALDSIPAVFGITEHAYIVFCANAFALLGLRPLYFLLAGLLGRVVYLSTGLAVILLFIGVKLLLHFAHLQGANVPQIGTALTLAVIVGVLAATSLASAVAVRRHPTLRAHAGSLTPHREPAPEREPAP